MAADDPRGGDLRAVQADLDRLDAAQTQAETRLAEDLALAGAYADLLSALRELARADPRKGEPNPRALARAARSGSAEARRCAALRGPRDGLARVVMRHLPLFELDPDDRYLAALACAREDPEAILAHLDGAGLEGTEPMLRVALLVLSRQPAMDFAEFKTQETVYFSIDPDDRQAGEARRRYEQAQGRRAQHARRHPIGRLPEALLARPEARFALLQTSLDRDPFGTLDHFRTQEHPDPCAGLDSGQRLDLLERVAACGLGLASNHLDLFGLPPDPELAPRLQAVFRQDVTAGSSILGVHALAGMDRYPFGLGRIEAVLPRRISSAEALAYLKKGEPEDAKPREYNAGEVGGVADRLQEQEVRRFLEVLKSDVGRQWKPLVGDRKREMVFADPDLKIRNILFLLAHALFEPEPTFEEIYRAVQRSHPMQAGDAARMLVLANRYYFLDLLGLNPGLLFNRMPRPGGGARTLIEEAGDYPVRSLLHVGMSIHLRVGGDLFRAMPIAWNILLGQFGGRIDAVFQELAFLFDGFDTLLTIAAGQRPDLRGWIGPLLDAMAEDVADLPDLERSGAPGTPLRLTTRGAMERCRERLNHYGVQALRRNARAAGVSPINVLQALRLPRVRIDRLRSMLDQEGRAAREAGAPARRR